MVDDLTTNNKDITMLLMLLIYLKPIIILLFIITVFISVIMFCRHYWPKGTTKVLGFMMLITPIIIPLYIFIHIGLGDRIIYKFKSVDFFSINESRFEQNDDIILVESFVVSNPPQNKLLLKEMVEENMFKTLSLETLKKHHIYRRLYFREGVCLTRNYKKGEPYPSTPWWSLEGWLTLGCFEYDGDDPGQQIRYHLEMEDYIMEIQFKYNSVDNCWIYSYNYGYRDRGYNREETVIRDIDSFFIENSKQYQ